MVQRRFWQHLLEEAWERKRIVWLSGVRRAGKTVLVEGLRDVEYFDCELPRTRRAMADPEGFLDGVRGKRVVLDEIHRLDNPSELLKIAADHYRDVRVIATGSSTLGASAKFRDTLTGRKADVWLSPMIHEDLEDFGAVDLDHRFLRGGLPPHFLAPSLPEREIQEWMDAYWAKDIVELFRLERRSSFMRFAEFLFAQSGGIFEASRFAGPCEVSRGTIANYLAALAATYVGHVVRPFSKHASAEIIAAPKVYAFDTGFVCAFRGWDSVRPDDRGPLWEHLVLNELCAHLQTRDIHYWRDKRGHEVDFVVKPRGRPPIAIECKWTSKRTELPGLEAFLRRYDDASAFIVCNDVKRAFVEDVAGKPARFVGLAGLLAEIPGAIGQRLPAP